MKSPDMFKKTMLKFLSYLKHNVKLYLSVGIAIIVITAISVTINHLQSKREEKARVKLYELAQKVEIIGSENIQGTISLIEETIPELGNTNAANEARYILAEIYYSNEEWESAAHYYGLVARNSRGIFRDLSLLGKAYSLENDGKLDEALVTFLNLKDKGGDVYKPVAMLGAGRSYQKMGRNDDALLEYESLILLYPESEYARMASVAKTKL